MFGFKIIGLNEINTGSHKTTIVGGAESIFKEVRTSETKRFCI